VEHSLSDSIDGVRASLLSEGHSLTFSETTESLGCGSILDFTADSLGFEVCIVDDSSMCGPIRLRRRLFTQDNTRELRVMIEMFEIEMFEIGIVVSAKFVG
jgi:hypothetical protein